MPENTNEEVVTPTTPETANEPLESTPATETPDVDPEDAKPVGPATVVDLDAPAETFPEHEANA